MILIFLGASGIAYILVKKQVNKDKINQEESSLIEKKYSTCLV